MVEIVAFRSLLCSRSKFLRSTLPLLLRLQFRSPKVSTPFPSVFSVFSVCPDRYSPSSSCCRSYSLCAIYATPTNLRSTTLELGWIESNRVESNRVESNQVKKKRSKPGPAQCQLDKIVRLQLLCYRFVVSPSPLGK